MCVGYHLIGVQLLRNLRSYPKLLLLIDNLCKIYDQPRQPLGAMMPLVCFLRPFQLRLLVDHSQRLLYGIITLLDQHRSLLPYKVDELVR